MLARAQTSQCAWQGKPVRVGHDDAAPEKHAHPEKESFRVEVCDRVNAWHWSTGLGGLTTVLDVKLRTFPTHASARCPSRSFPNVSQRACSASASPRIPGSTSPLQVKRPGGLRQAGTECTACRPRQPEPGGKGLLEDGRNTSSERSHSDGARCRPQTPERYDRPRTAPDIPAGADPVLCRPCRCRGEVVGPAGPTTSTRMDKFTPRLLAGCGPAAMIGKGERGPETISAIARHKTPYLIAVGGAALLVSRAIRESRIVAYPDLGIDAIREFRIENMPVIVAVDTDGNSIHEQGPQAMETRKLKIRPL
ncbi:MAG: fumarate hydratase C-terminal domain-containing protein [Hyphomonas sp.]